VNLGYLEKKMYNKSIWGSSKRFNIQVQHTITFTIGIVNLKALQRNPIFFQVYRTNCSKQIESSHVGKKIHEMKKWGSYSGPIHAQSPRIEPKPVSITFGCH
jgi:hypothetical protein